jgi:hypothetical protein
MKQRKWMAVSALAAVVGAGSLMAAQAAPEKATGKVLLAAKGDKKAGAGKRGGRGPQVIPAQMLEKILGKPLTDDQKKGVKEAADTYNESVAKALGMTVDELKAKAQEYRKNNAGAGKDKKAA